jgi:hypothetical protein
VNLYLHGTELNMRGRPMSSEKITVVPVGPMTHLTVFGPIASALAAFACTK